ncbi:3-hydroxyacyl-CoA dehydrogenase family protein [Streptomyces sp. JNUCC 64]
MSPAHPAPSASPAAHASPSSPRSRPLSEVAVVGLGTMGTGIVEVLIRSGRNVVGVDVSDAAVARATADLAASTLRAVGRGLLGEGERAAALARFRATTELSAVVGAELVIEATPESHATKRDVLSGLDALVAPDTIIATCTNALSVTRLAAESARPERVLGLHFFHPAPVMRLVQVVSSVLTSPAAVAAVTELARELGKEPVAAGDRPGFVADGLLFGYLNQAAVMYESRYARREDIDAAMRLGCGLPMGPLALLDLIGVDTARAVLDALHTASHDRLYAPAPVLGQLSAAGLTGRKAGRGFYTYAEPGAAAVVPDALTPPGAGPGGPPGPPGRPVRSVGIAGSGTMAAGIAEVFATAGYEVVLAARDRRRADAARSRIAASLDRSVARGRASGAAASAALGRITPAGGYGAFAGVDLAVEAVAEDLAVKRTLFGTLDAVCRPGAVLATTTSSLPVIACARATRRPEDVVGMHFFNPAPAMRLVEVVRTVLTSDDAHTTVREVCAGLGKRPVECGDRAGFIVNALLFPYLNNAVKLVQDHYASPDQIDTAMKLGGGYPMGPFELLDVVGLDVSLAIEKALHREFREPGLAPAPLLEHLVAAGRLGRKTGRGFREHTRR